MEYVYGLMTTKPLFRFALAPQNADCFKTIIVAVTLIIIIIIIITIYNAPFNLEKSNPRRRQKYINTQRDRGKIFSNIPGAYIPEDPLHYRHLKNDHDVTQHVKG